MLPESFLQPMDERYSSGTSAHLSDRLKARHRQGGVSLLEVMIAVLVLAVGVLGAASLQLNAIRYSVSAGHSTQAALAARDMLDRMRANPSELSRYATASVAGVCQVNPGGADIAAQDLADFAELISCELPVANGSIAVVGDQATVSISWSEARTVANEEDTVFLMSSVIR
ncbi:MAG: type IV pilus assembly protein PilV [Halopseudomonas sp.]|jgi:type IV pilus assembly protein PilV|uniref:type IV pilus modification protein PilV n=1 Tax=Halopseudomonas sp. TaxID=2901191 RepID=UPI0039E3E3E5